MHSTVFFIMKQLAYIWRRNILSMFRERCTYVWLGLVVGNFFFVKIEVLNCVLAWHKMNERNTWTQVKREFITSPLLPCWSIPIYFVVNVFVWFILMPGSYTLGGLNHSEGIFSLCYHLLRLGGSKRSL
jgi:hypothetical protein